ncbi:hypothetical protein KGY14_10740 [Ameyamaea chiangmaiensis]|uniref:Flagellar biosynthesis protein FliO n=1 Tax=Ameyamaea chiangmaiensis TaxID=442969 RepID=A0A850PAE5_9PROT|nr:hypothetical protein [Ameyamaea chiangmaiensis]MBS4075667.1 hypothetical protein [Ameyamaea chiangmaiensis]NVN40918.1 hypothetical protein [Ameyamaea chiangmaiensis]
MMFSSTLALIAVIAMILLLRLGAVRTAFLRRHGTPDGDMKITARLSLDGGKRHLTLLDIAGHQAVVLTGGPSDLLVPWPATDRTIPSGGVA